MAAQLPRPGVEILQEFRSTSPTIILPTLVPCNVAPFFEVIEVLNADSTLNDDSKLLALYQQLGLTVSQSSFPSPRGNIDEVDVGEDSVRVFFNHGGALLELSRTSGFLANLNSLATAATMTGSGGSYPANLDGKKLLLALNAHTAVGGTTSPTTGDIPTSAVVTIEFEDDGMTLTNIVDFINSKIPGLASDDGGELKLTSSRYGAGSSVMVLNPSSSAAVDLGLYFTAVDHISVGAGLYVSDDADGDLRSPRIEHFTGSTVRPLGSINVPIVAPGFPVDFTTYFIEPGDQLIASGLNIGEVDQVFPGRLVMDVEQNIFGSSAPFAPKYVWVQANNLVFPAPLSSTTATQTGVIATSSASRAFIVAQAAFSAVGAGETFDIDTLIEGVSDPTAVIGSAAGWANLGAAVTGINAQTTALNWEAYVANDVGDEVDVSLVGANTRLGLRLKASLTGSTSAITLSDISPGMVGTLGFSGLPVGDVGENVRYQNGTAGFGVGTSAWGAGGGPATSGNTILFTPTVNGVAKPAETVTWSSTFPDTAPAGLDAAIADFNAQAIHAEAYKADSLGVESNSGTYLAIRTRGENVGSDAELDVTGGTDVALVGGIATNTGTDADLDGASFRWRVDNNPQTYEVLFSKDEDDGGTSIQHVIDKVNDITPNVAAADTSIPPKLLLTSGMVGEGSAITIVDGTANPILGFTDNVTVNGDGRPLPDLSLDISGNALIQNQILRDGLTGLPFSGTVAPIHIAYKALRLDLSPDADNPGLLVVDSTTILETVASPISSDNPGALMTFLTLINSPGTSATAIGVPEISADAPDGTPIGYAKCAEFLESEEVYAISLASQNTVVHQTFLTHVNFMSEPEQKGERILFFNPTTPERANPVLLGSGTDANTTAMPGKVTVDVSLAAALIGAGIDPALVNPLTGVAANPVYLDLGSDDGAYLVQRVENGTEVYLRKDFLAGEGNEDAFFGTTFPTGIISDDWSIFIRGAELLIPGSTLPDKNGIAETIQGQGNGYGMRRGFFMFPDQIGINVTGLEQLVPGYYAGSCVIGMVANLPPQQGFTNFPITGITRVVGSNEFFSERQLNTIAAGGIYMLVQDVEGGPVTCRHQLSTDLSSIEARELSITKVVDFTAKFLRGGLRNFIGRSNITQSFLDQLSSVVQGILSFLTDAGALIGAEVNNVIQDADAPDTVLIDVTLDVPYPCNYIRVTLVV